MDKPIHFLVIFIMLPLFVETVFSQITGSFQIGGTLRDYIVTVPNDVNNPPLVINMHGLTSNASQQRAYTRFDQIASLEKFIVVYPNGLNNTWDITGNKDVQFISALIDTMHSRYNVDLNKVYATGFSMGGYMSHRLGCALSYRIAAIAPVSGLNASYQCNPTRPVPVLQIHGVADSIVRYSGVGSTISGWVNRNRCPINPVTTSPYPENRPQSLVTKQFYGPGNQGCEVILLSVEGGGHSWFNTADLNCSEEIWDFFKNHSLTITTAVHYGSSRMCLAQPSLHIVNDYLNISGLHHIQSIEMYSLQGKTYFESKKVDQRSSFTIPLAKTPAGVYIIKIKAKDQNINIPCVLY